VIVAQKVFLVEIVIIMNLKMKNLTTGTMMLTTTSLLQLDRVNITLN
jgi:hypothetical protein